MDDGLILLGFCGVIFTLISPVAMVVLGVVVYGMRDQLHSMQSQIQDLEIQLAQRPAIAPQPAPVPALAAHPPEPKPAPEPVQAPAPEPSEVPTPTDTPEIAAETAAEEAAPKDDAAPKSEEADTESDPPEEAPEKALEDAPEPPPSPETAIPAPSKEPAPTPAPKPTPKPAPLPKQRSLEQTLGATVAVWGGGATLGLAAILLVQYGIQNEWLGPNARLGLGLFVSLGLVLGGELAFKKLRPVGGGLVGAGIIGLYATFASAQGLYDLISPLTAGALMVLTTLIAATLSIRHNLLIIAVLGLLGGFLTPFLVGVRTGSPVGLLTYLLVLDIGVVVVAVWRKWPILLVMDAALTGFAEMAWLFDNDRQESVPYVLLVLLVAIPTIAASFVGAGFVEKPEDAESWTVFDRIDAAAQNPWGFVGLHAPILTTSLVALSAAIWWNFPTSTWWMQLPMLALAMLSLGLSKHAPRTLPVLVSMALILQHWVWTLSTEPTIPAMIQISAFVGVFCAGGFALLAIQRPKREFEAICTLLVTLLQFLLAFLYMIVLQDDSPDTAQDAPERLWWALCGAGLAAVFAGVSAAQWWRHKAAGHEGTPKGAQWTAMGAAIFLALAAPIVLDEQWLTLAWLVLTFAFVAIGQATRQGTVIAVAVGILVLVAGRLLTPWSFDQLRGDTPIFNWILVLYGSAVACCLLCSWWLSRGDMLGGGARLAIRLLGLAFFLGLITLEIRHFFHPDLRGAFTRGEDLAYSISWLGVGLGSLLFGLFAKSKVSRWVSLTLVMGTSLKIFLYDLSFLDGLWRVGSLAALGFLLIGIATLYRLYVLPSDEVEQAA